MLTVVPQIYIVSYWLALRISIGNHFIFYRLLKRISIKFMTCKFMLMPTMIFSLVIMLDLLVSFEVLLQFCSPPLVAIMLSQVPRPSLPGYAHV